MMSFDEGLSGQLSEAKECKPDYETMAARVNKQIEVTSGLQDALFRFIDTGEIHQFRNISSLAEMVGGIALVLRKQTAHYEELLRKIEQGK